jgi:hypothetical protein
MHPVKCGDFDDPEASYRRGYQQGAYAAVMAAERLMRSAVGRKKLQDWVNLTVYTWRYLTKPKDRSIRPPDPPN